MHVCGSTLIYAITADTYIPLDLKRPSWCHPTT